MEVLNNPTFQTILGAFLGALLGWLFSLTSSSPKSEYSNLTIIETKTFVRNEFNKESKKEGVDPFSILIILFGVLVFGAFGYVKFNEEIFEYVFFYQSFSFAFIVITFISALVLGRIDSKEWLTRILLPIIIFIFTTFILKCLKNNIPDNLIQNANTVEIWVFVKNLTSYGRNFLLYQLISFILTLLVSILSLISFINYFSLMNLRGSKGLRIWYYIHKYTKIGSGSFYYVFSALLLILVILIQTDWFNINILDNQ